MQGTQKILHYLSKGIRFSFEVTPAVLLSRLETMLHVSTVWTASRLLSSWNHLYCFIELTYTKSFLIICDSKPLVCLEKKFLSAVDRATWERGNIWFLDSSSGFSDTLFDLNRIINYIYKHTHTLQIVKIYENGCCFYCYYECSIYDCRT